MKEELMIYDIKGEVMGSLGKEEEVCGVVQVGVRIQ